MEPVCVSCEGGVAARASRSHIPSRNSSMLLKGSESESTGSAGSAATSAVSGHGTRMSKKGRGSDGTLVLWPQQMLVCQHMLLPLLLLPILLLLLLLVGVLPW